jgi:hypothetical protein
VQRVFGTTTRDTGDNDGAVAAAVARQRECRLFAKPISDWVG